MSESYIQVTLIKSPIGRKKSHLGTLRALGLRKPGTIRKLKATPVIRGMVRSVGYLLKIEEGS